jgi:hypothetical protein
MSLARALEACGTLTSLTLAFNALGSVAAAALAEALKVEVGTVGQLRRVDLKRKTTGIS